MPVRNEAWCLGLTLRAALMWCDEVVCLDHACTDLSSTILQDIEAETHRVSILQYTNPAWDEMRHRQMMLTEARRHGATHIAIVDADEIVTGNLLQSKNFPNLGEFAGWLKPGHCLQLPMYQLRGSLDRYHANGIWGNRWLSVAFADDPRLSWSGDKFHAREPQGMSLRPYRPIQHGQGGVFHLWGVSERRLCAKHALYKITERLKWPSKKISEIDEMYNLWIDENASVRLYGTATGVGWGQPWTFADVPAEWWDPYRGIMHDNLWPNENPWQEAEVRRLVGEHGAERFKGLDLFGIA